MSDPADEQTTTTTELPPETTTTEAAPPETTTGEAAPSGTTTAGGTTTTLAPPGDGPAFSEVSVAIDPDDGQDQHSKSIEISTDAALILSWSTNKATAVRIDDGEYAWASFRCSRWARTCVAGSASTSRLIPPWRSGP